MIEIDPVFGKAEADEARFRLLCCSEPVICENQGKTILSIVAKSVWPGHCHYRGL
jgi:hypothetical protein